MNILINASNLHVGGGVQVAASLINEITKLLERKEYHFKISILISREVQENLDENLNLSVFYRYNVLDFSPSKTKIKTEQQYFNGYDIILTIFGPFYYFVKCRYEITGFAQAWIAYPNNIAYKLLTRLQKIKYKLIYFLKSLFFKKSDFLIVEAQHVKDALYEVGYNSENIFVINNTVSSVFDENKTLKDIDYIRSENFTLGFIGRNYKHKNLKILKDVNNILLDKFDLKCDFLFTLNDSEMEDNGFNALSNFYTVGSISVEQCPSFYNKIDALIFPSLLECFSATPIEAMKMEKLVIASNLPFVTDICKSSARYFDPISPESIAAAIYLAISEPDKNLKLITEAKLLVENLPTAKDRALAYLDILSNLK